MNRGFSKNGTLPKTLFQFENSQWVQAIALFENGAQNADREKPRLNSRQNFDRKRSGLEKGSM